MKPIFWERQWGQSSESSGMFDRQRAHVREIGKMLVPEHGPETAKEAEGRLYLY